MGLVEKKMETTIERLAIKVPKGNPIWNDLTGASVPLCNLVVYTACMYVDAHAYMGVSLRKTKLPCPCLTSVLFYWGVPPCTYVRIKQFIILECRTGTQP